MAEVSTGTLREYELLHDDVAEKIAAHVVHLTIDRPARAILADDFDAICHLTALTSLDIDCFDKDRALVAITPQLSQLRCLQQLFLQSNYTRDIGIPLEVCHLLALSKVTLMGIRNCDHLLCPA